MQNLSEDQSIKSSSYESSNNSQKNTLQRNILTSCALADLLKTSLGPNGLSKLIVDEYGKTIISADGATILRSLKVCDPAAALLVQAAQAQEFAFGDGTSSVPILSAQLLREAQKLLFKGISATRIAFGYQSALQHVERILHRQVVKEITDLTDSSQLREGITIALSSKQTQQNEFIIDLLTRAISKCFNAKKRLKEMKTREIFSLENTIAKKKFQTEMKFLEELNVPLQFKANDLNVILVPGKPLTASELVDGVIISRVSRTSRKEMKECKIALVLFSEDPFELTATTQTSKQKIYLTEPQQLRKWKTDESNLIKQQMTFIRNAGANVVVTTEKLNELMIHFLDSFDMIALDRVPLSQFRHLAESCGATICHHLSELSEDDLGRADKINLIDLAGNQCTLFSGLPFESKVTILLHATSIQLCEEVRRCLEDGVHTVKVLTQNGKLIPGAGAAEVDVGIELREIADNTKGVDQFIWRAFGEACFVIPMTLAENAGANPFTTLAALLEKHKQGHKNFGVGAERGSLIDAQKEKIYDLLATKKNMFGLATNCAVTILRAGEIFQI